MHGVYSDDAFGFRVSHGVELLSCARHRVAVVERTEVADGCVSFDLRYAGAPPTVVPTGATAREPRWLYTQWALAA